MFNIVHARNNSDQYSGHGDNEEWLDPGYILRNEPTGFLGRLDMEEGIKDDFQIWGLKSRTDGFHFLKWVGLEERGALLQNSLLDVLI